MKLPTMSKHSSRRDKYRCPGPLPITDDAESACGAVNSKGEDWRISFASDADPFERLLCPTCGLKWQQLDVKETVQ